MVKRSSAALADDLTLAVAWLALIASPVTLFVGHLGAVGLDWRKNQVSTYAAKAPNDDWVTATMLLAAVALVGIAVNLHRALAADLISRALSTLLGAGAAGLVLLACFEVGGGYRQGKHDAGLVLFLIATTAAFAVAGGAIAVTGPGWRQRVAGTFVAGCALGGTGSLEVNWTPLWGLHQRTAFLGLWVAALFLLGIVSSVGRRNSKGARDEQRP